MIISSLTIFFRQPLAQLAVFLCVFCVLVPGCTKDTGGGVPVSADFTIQLRIPGNGDSKEVRSAAVAAESSIDPQQLYLLLFRGMPIDGPDLLQPEALRWAWVILPAVLVLACTGLFLGACIQRWGRRALWLLWAAYMAVFLFGDTFTRLAEGAGRDTLLGRALGAVVDVLAFIPGGPARVLLALALLTAATVSGAALLLRGSVRQTA